MIEGVKSGTGKLCGKVCEKFHKLLAMSLRDLFNARLTDEFSGLSGLRAGAVSRPSLCRARVSAVALILQ
jgi:hypothetical protein